LSFLLSYGLNLKAIAGLRAIAYLNYSLLKRWWQFKDPIKSSFCKALVALRALAYIKSYSLPKRMAAA
jgi:hypothetical protein